MGVHTGHIGRRAPRAGRCSARWAYGRAGLSSRRIAPSVGAVRCDDGAAAVASSPPSMTRISSPPLELLRAHRRAARLQMPRLVEDRDEDVARSRADVSPGAPLRRCCPRPIRTARVVLARDRHGARSLAGMSSAPERTERWTGGPRGSGDQRADDPAGRDRRRGVRRRVRAAVDRRAPRARRPSAVHDGRDRGARRPAAARIRPARAGRPAARELRVRVRRGRPGTAVGDRSGTSSATASGSRCATSSRRRSTPS